MFHQPQFSNNRVPNNFFMPGHSTFPHRTSKANQNLDYSRDFEQFQMPPQGFNSTQYPFYHSTRWRQQYRRTPAFHFQDKSTFYYMSDPIFTNDHRITVKLKILFFQFELFSSFLSR
jgi:hypothetical protein